MFDIDIDDLITYVCADDNKRIEAAADIRVMHRNTGLAAGVVILILFGYVISVFVAHRLLYLHW